MEMASEVDNPVERAWTAVEKRLRGVGYFPDDVPLRGRMQEERQGHVEGSGGFF
jgi:hypothetical protein